jgi:hypothetical protein
MALVFDKYLKLITIEAPQTELDVQDLYNDVRLFEELNQNLEVAQICIGTGKQALGGGVYVGITVELINNWRIQFEARPGLDYVAVRVSGGNLVATNDYGNNPINPTAFTQVTIANSSSATLTDDANLRNLKYLLETQREEHGGFGTTYYWNPANGDDGLDALSPLTAVATFAAAHALCVSGNNDVIIGLSSQTGGSVTTTEKIVFSKDSVHLRGQGPTFRMQPDSEGDVVTFTGEFCSIENLKIVPYSASGTSNAITVTSSSNHIRIEKLLIISAPGDGIEIQGGNFHVLNKVRIEDSAGNGIHISGNVNEVNIENSFVDDSTLYGIKIDDSSSDDIRIIKTEIHRSMQYGIGIGTGVAMTRIYANNFLSHNALGRFENNGSFTHFEASSTNSEFPAAVWDVAIADHLTAGSVGKTLKDTKTKATLASLK